jgi:small subunit ribosomal protein S17
MGRPRENDDAKIESAEETAPDAPEAEAEQKAEVEATPGAPEEPAPEAVAAVAEPPKTKKRLPRAERRQRPRPRRERPQGKAPTRPPKPERVRGRRKERRGIVVSAAMDKTIVVRVDTVRPHPVYKKIVRRSRRFQAHDETNVAKLGDVVRIVETRPLSKAKNWRLAEVLEEAK